MERFVVEQIKRIGSDPNPQAATVEQVRARSEARQKELQTEQRKTGHVLKRLHGEFKTCIQEPDTDRLAELQEQLQRTERRLVEVQQELVVLERACEIRMRSPQHCPTSTVCGPC